MGVCKNLPCCAGADNLDDLAGGRRRACTDILCLILFLGSVGILIALSVVAVDREPHLIDDLLYPRDSYGNNCGKSGTATAAMTKVFYPQLDKDIMNQWATVVALQWWSFTPTRMCTSSCPSGFSLKTPISYGGDGYPVQSGYSTASTYWYSYQTQDVLDRCFPKDTSSATETTELCAVPACYNTTLNASLSGSVHCVAVAAQPDADNVWEVCPSGTSTSLCASQQAACELRVQMAQVDTFTPTEQTSDTEAYTRQFASYVQLAVGAFESCLTDDGYIVILVAGVAFPILGGMSWMFFIWMFAGVLVYVAILTLFVLEIALCLWLGAKAGWFESAGIDLTAVVNTSLTQQADDDMKTWYTVFAALAIILTVWHMIGMWLSRRAVARLIAILREVTKVFKQMAMIIFWPLMSVMLQLAVFVGGMLMFYFYCYAYIGTGYVEDWVGVLFVFGEVCIVLWVLEVVRGAIWMSMSGAVALWYVKDAGTDQGCCSVGGGCTKLCSSTVRTVTKHLGSVCFGALIITIVRVIRMLFYLLEYSMKDRVSENMLLKLLFKCIHCLLYCIEKTVEYISLWGYIFVAVHGTSFCRSCFDSFAFQLKYFSQTLVNKSVQFILKLMIKLTITVGCTFIAFCWLDNDADFTAQYNPIWPTIVVMLASYIISGAFCTVFDVSIDTIYLCAFEDMERVKNNAGATLYMSDDLRVNFGIDKQQADKEADPSAAKMLEEKGQKRAVVEPSSA